MSYNSQVLNTFNSLCNLTKCSSNQFRGSNTGPNYEAKFVSAISEQLEKAKLPKNIMIDCSHGNSSKKHENQILVAKDIAQQISEGNHDIMGVMIESNLREGRQDVPPEGPDFLKFGVSITDACVSFDDTIPMLQGLADAVKQRRLKK